jgi:hypothetical protein
VNRFDSAAFSSHSLQSLALTLFAWQRAGQRQAALKLLMVAKKNPKALLVA